MVAGRHDSLLYDKTVAQLSVTPEELLNSGTRRLSQLSSAERFNGGRQA